MASLGILLLLLGLTSESAHAQIAPRRDRDPCLPGRIEFDAKRCEEENQRQGGSSKHSVNGRGEWGTALPIRGDQLESISDPALVESEFLLESWSEATLAYRPDIFDRCFELGMAGMTEACIAQIRKDTRQSYFDRAARLASTPLAELEAELRAFDPVRSADLPSSRLQAAILVYKMLAQPNGQALLNVLRTEGTSLPKSERLLVVQRIGGLFLSAYDQQRNNDGLLAKDGVKLDELLAFHRAREIEYPSGGWGSLWGFQPPTGPSFLGVCRDIASAQGEMLIALGFPETYIVAYFPTGALHTTLLIEDPEHPGKYYRMNYSRLNTSPGSGPDMLYQDDGASQQDVTLRYFIHRPGGETLATVPSELGLLLTRALRGDAAMDRLAPGYVPRGWSFSGGVSLNERVHLKGFGGVDSRGDRYRGAGIVVELGDKRSIYTQDMGVAAFLRDAGPLVTENLYLFYEGTLRTKDLVLDDGDRVKLHGEAMLYVAALITDIRNFQGFHNPSYGADTRAAFALESLFGRGTDRVNGSLRVEAQLTPGVGDIRDVGTVRAQIDQVLAEGAIFLALSQSKEGREELYRTAAGRAYLYGIVTALFDHWGKRGVARVGFDSKWVGLEGRYSGRIETDSPIFRAAAIREVAVKLMVKLGRYGVAYAEATRPLEMERFEGVGPRIRVGGEFQVPFGRR